jgi:hypothetical protein
MELVIASVVGSMVVVSAGMVVFQVMTATRQMSDMGMLMANGQMAIGNVRSLLERVEVWDDAFGNPVLDNFTVVASDVRFRTYGLHFIADLDRDGFNEWVWLWMDWRALSGAPGFGELRATAFRRYGDRGWRAGAANFDDPFYGSVNGDTTRYVVLCQRLAPVPPSGNPNNEPESLRFQRVLPPPPASLASGPGVRVTMRVAVDTDNTGKINTQPFYPWSRKPFVTFQSFLWARNAHTPALGGPAPGVLAAQDTPLTFGGGLILSSCVVTMDLASNRTRQNSAILGVR